MPQFPDRKGGDLVDHWIVSGDRESISTSEEVDPGLGVSVANGAETGRGHDQVADPRNEHYQNDFWGLHG